MLRGSELFMNAGAGSPSLHWMRWIRSSRAMLPCHASIPHPPGHICREVSTSKTDAMTPRIIVLTISTFSLCPLEALAQFCTMVR
jgi:hypothetical protein